MRNLFFKNTFGTKHSISQMQQFFYKKKYFWKKYYYFFNVHTCTIFYKSYKNMKNGNKDGFPKYKTFDSIQKIIKATSSLPVHYVFSPSPPKEKIPQNAHRCLLLRGKKNIINNSKLFKSFILCFHTLFYMLLNLKK